MLYLFLLNSQSLTKIFTFIIYEIQHREKEESFDQDLDSLLQSLEELQAETEEAQLQDRKCAATDSDSSGDNDIKDQPQMSVESNQQQQMQVVGFLN